MTKDNSLTDENFFASTASETNSWNLEEIQGQLAVDVYQTKNDVVVKAPVAGVEPEQIEIVVTSDSISIKGERYDETEVDQEGYHAQECYWGSFARRVILPVECDSEGADATFKKGILTVRIPKLRKAGSKRVHVKGS